MFGPYRTACAVFVLSLVIAPLSFTEVRAESGWRFSPYLRADLGYSITVDDDADLIDTGPERDTTDMAAKKGARIQVGAGLQLNSYLRTDITLSYRDGLAEAEAYMDSDGIPNKPSNELEDGGYETSNLTVLLNVYVDPLTAAGIDTGGFSPYLQGGIGWARNETEDLTFVGGTTVEGAIHNDLAWQVGGGIAYAFTDAWAVDLSYRFISMGEAHSSRSVVSGAGTPFEVPRETRFDLMAHEVLLGVRYRF